LGRGPEEVGRMELDLVMLLRIQFGFLVSFHLEKNLKLPKRI
jgi:hypothetical protein